MEHGREKDILGVTLKLSIGVIVSLCVRCILLENLYLYSFVKQIFGSPTSHMRNVLLLQDKDAETVKMAPLPKTCSLSNSSKSKECLA